MISALKKYCMKIILCIILLILIIIYINKNNITHDKSQPGKYGNSIKLNINHILELFILYNININHPIQLLKSINFIAYSYYEINIHRNIDIFLISTKNKEIHELLNMNDPFTSSTLKCQKGIIYSIGPDLIDNYSYIRYDPTNGIISSGDIIVKHITSNNNIRKY